MPKHHYTSKRHYIPWTDNKTSVCVLPQQCIIPFQTPTYWNDNSKRTQTSDVAVASNYSFNSEYENEITEIEEKGYDVIKSILKNKVIPNQVFLAPLCKLISLFISNNPVFRGEIKNALKKNEENIIAVLKEEIAPQDDNEFFIASIKGMNPLSPVSLQIANDLLYPYIKENFRFQLLKSNPKKSFITSDIPVILIPPSNNHPLWHILWGIKKFTWYYKNGAVASLEVNLNNEDRIKSLTLLHPDPNEPNLLNKPIESVNIDYEYNCSEINIHHIYFPISPQLALHGVNTEYAIRFHNLLVMLSENETLERNSWILSYISDHSKTKAVGGNYEILEQSAIYHNSKNISGPRYIPIT